ncbi:MAG: helix-hairpin-helix domain-containing protein [Marinilabiliaceae bacterium]
MNLSLFLIIRIKRLSLRVYLIFTILLVFSGLFFPIPSFAQGEDDIRQWAEEVADIYAGEMETEDLSPLLEELTSLAMAPLNINTADREQLGGIFFLSDMQIENILYRRYVSGPFQSVYELQTVEGLPVSVIRLLEPVIYFGESDEEDAPWRVWGDWFIRSEYQMEKARGFETGEDNETPFAGPPFKLYSRTSFNTNKGLDAGFIAENDPGEPMFSEGTSGLDLMTGYIHYENQNHWLREAAAGQYKMSSGQGLAVRSGMPLRKSSLTTSIRNRGRVFRPSLSASESSGMLGSYATFGVGSFEISPFFSMKYRDGRIQGDTCLVSIREDGLHRTLTEREQRHNAKEQVAGVRARFESRILNVEAGHLLYSIDPPLYPEQKVYNRFDFRGKEVRNSWVSFLMSKKGLLAFGEVAFNHLDSSPALWNGFIWSAAPGFSLALGHRSIPLDYRAPLAGPMTESSRFAGENGLYAGMEWEVGSGFVLSSYIDRYRFGWLRYRTDAPSKGFDWLARVEKEFKEDTRLRIRYRHREKPVNDGKEKHESPIRQNVYDQLKAQYRYSLSQWQFTTLGQWHFVGTGEGKERGYMLAQDIRRTTLDEKLTLTMRYALFHTSDYQARLYAYEPHVLYMFSVPAFSGSGSRYLLLCNYKLKKYLHLWLRAARLHYEDREKVSSGYNQIDSDKKTVFTLQLRLKF